MNVPSSENENVPTISPFLAAYESIPLSFLGTPIRRTGEVDGETLRSSAIVEL